MLHDVDHHKQVYGFFRLELLSTFGDQGDWNLTKQFSVLIRAFGDISGVIDGKGIIESDLVDSEANFLDDELGLRPRSAANLSHVVKMHSFYCAVALKSFRYFQGPIVRAHISPPSVKLRDRCPFP